MNKLIQKAVDAGYKWRGYDIFLTEFSTWAVTTNQNVPASNMYVTLDPEVFFLDPKFWQALGKAEGWKEENADLVINKDGINLQNNLPEWCENMHRMVASLCQGKTLQEFIETL